MRARPTFLAAALLLAAAAPALAEADGPDYFRVRGVAQDDTLNIRAAPSASAAILGAIPPNGDGIRNLGCQGGLSFGEWQKATDAQRRAAEKHRWCHISYRGIEGWAAGRFLGEGGPP